MKNPRLVLLLLGGSLVLFFVYKFIYKPKGTENGELFIYDKECNSEADFVPYQLLVYGVKPIKEGNIDTILSCPCGDTSLYLVVYSDTLQNFEAEEEKIRPAPNREGDISKNFIFDFPLMQDPEKVIYINLEKAVHKSDTSSNKISVLDTGVKGEVRSYVDSTQCPYYDRPDVHGHGSFVSYITIRAISEASNHQSGLKYNIISYNVTNENGDIDLFNVMCALRHAAKDSSKVINMSFGAYQEIDMFRNFIYTLLSEYPKLTLVTSAGNNHIDLDLKVHVPSTYYRSFPGRVIQVGALERPNFLYGTNGWRMWTGSNHLTTGNIVAQGVHLFKSLPPNPQDYYARGTSFAAPIVSGLKVINYPPLTASLNPQPPIPDFINQFTYRIN